MMLFSGPFSLIAFFSFYPLVSNIPVYKLGGRLYPVGNLANFNYATSVSPGEKYEVTLKLYTEAVV
jgi:hypothetical protein